jgi:hypothetical protein
MKIGQPKPSERVKEVGCLFHHTYLGDGSYIMIQQQLDTNYFIGLAISVLCQG